jgi:hypothetical protein
MRISDFGLRMSSPLVRIPRSAIRNRLARPLPQAVLTMLNSVYDLMSSARGPAHLHE